MSRSMSDRRSECAFEAAALIEVAAINARRAVSPRGDQITLLALCYLTSIRDEPKRCKAEHRTALGLPKDANPGYPFESLEKAGLIERWSGPPNPALPAMAYYRITPKGHARLKEAKKAAAALLKEPAFQKLQRLLTKNSRD